MRLKQWVGILVLGALFFNLATASAADLPPRPPQYVLLAFDGSLNLDMWHETLAFAKENELKFTYFISGVYFLLDSKRKEYVEPTHGAGKSAIGFGGDSLQNIRTRAGYLNQAYSEGNEIASHVNGHFDGGRWSLANWQSEFSQFDHLIFDLFKINGIDPGTEKPFLFSQEEVNGFRAPLLGYNSSMYQVLREKRYHYDTSKTAPMNYWPEKQNGIWNFPLAEVRIAGTGKKTLSMDYNFYYAHSGATSDSAHYQRYKTEMLNTYLAYFGANYHGNRAPIHIGHHFSKWNGGAYWDAMKEFAREVCHQAEVKCVTYRELDGFMEGLPQATLAQYRSGKFDSSGMPVHLASLEQMNQSYEADLRIVASPTEGHVRAQLLGLDAKNLLENPEAIWVWSRDGQEIQRGRANQLNLLSLGLSPSPSPQDLAAGADSKLSLSMELDGNEILRATHVLSPALAAEPDEDRALAGDLPEAHLGE